MKTIIKSTILASTSLFLLFACSDEDSLDTTKPEITIFKPTEHQEFELGDAINIEALLKDNVELSRYKIEIHSGNDGHDHGDENHQHRTINTTSNNDLKKFEFQDEGPLTGKEFILTKTIPLPIEAIEEGHYHLGIYAIDKAGNQSESFIEIVIGEDHDH